MTTDPHQPATPPAPATILTRVLLIVFFAEAVVMFILPVLLPDDTSDPIRAAVDSTLLTLISAPILWWAIIGPLRGTAIAERSRAESIIEAAADGIITTNDEGVIDSFNVAAERMFGYTAQQAIG